MLDLKPNNPQPLRGLLGATQMNAQDYTDQFDTDEAAELRAQDKHDYQRIMHEAEHPLLGDPENDEGWQ
jgi:hypothetical protein